MYIIKEMNVIRNTLEDIKNIEDVYITMRRRRQRVKKEKEKERSKRRRKSNAKSAVKNITKAKNQQVSKKRNILWLTGKSC